MPYKRNLEVGDEAIPKRTAYRYKIKESNRGLDVPNEKEEHSSNTSSIDDENIGNESRGPQIHHEGTDSYESHGNWVENLRKAVSEDAILDNNRLDYNPKNLQEFIQIEDFFLPFTIPLDATKGELFLMLLKYSVSNSYGETEMTNLLKLINGMFKTPILPDSHYIIDKLFNPKDRLQFHSVCWNCSVYIGEFDNVKSVKICNICGAKIDLDNPSNTSFFVLIDPSTRIADFLNVHENHYDYVVKKRIHRSGYIADVYDSNEYLKFVSSLADENKHSYVSATFNIGQAPTFQSSEYSIWPLFLKINELPDQIRNDKLVTCGLWFNKKKPDMIVFLDKFVDLINNITERGIPCIIKGENRLMNLHVISCCVDTIVRAQIQGINPFNSTHGCNWCLNPGKYTEGSIKYPIMDEMPDNRNHKETVKLMIESSVENIPFGIEYPSPLINLPNFNIIRGFIPDYKHCCLEGVASQFTTYFLENLSNDEIKMLDDEMNLIAAPNQVTWPCRPLSSRNDWKAKEWENYCLFYSLPVLSIILPNKKLEHWLLFVDSLFTLLKNEIHVNEINEADKKLHRFVREAEDLYGIRAMSFNVHQLQHLCESVIDWGPLWTNSTFSLETANYHLLKTIKCAKDVKQEIARFVNINHIMLIVEECVCRQAIIAVRLFCKDVPTARMQNICRTSKIAHFGADEGDNSDVLNTLEISNKSVKVYRKIIKQRCLFEGHSGSKSRSDNSFAILNNGTFIHIISFIVDDEKELELTLCNIINTKQFSASYKKMKIIDQISEEVTTVPTKSIDKICIHIHFDGKGFLCPLPNLLHY